MRKHYITWLSDDVVGFYSSQDSYLSYINVSSGEIRYFYVRKYVGWASYFALVGRDKLFIMDYRGNASLVDTERDEPIWTGKKYVDNPMTLINYRDRPVIATAYLLIKRKK